MADHKYIEKIVKNGKTRYFYTVEELNAYKKALSSKDEADKYISSALSPTGKPKRKTHYTDSDRKRLLKLAKINTDNARERLNNKGYINSVKKNAPEFYKKLKRKDKYRSDYERAKTVKGKAEDVKKVFNKYNPETAKKIEKGKKKVDRVVKEMKGYKNALSSKDEADKYIKSAYGEDKKVTNKNRDKLVKKINNDYKKTSKLMKKKGMAEYLEYEDPNLMKRYKNTEKKKRDYEKAKTTKGKIDDLKKNYKKYHPSKNNQKKF